MSGHENPGPDCVALAVGPPVQARWRQAGVERKFLTPPGHGLNSKRTECTALMCSFEGHSSLKFLMNAQLILVASSLLGSFEGHSSLKFCVNAQRILVASFFHDPVICSKARSVVQWSDHTAHIHGGPVTGRKVPRSGPPLLISSEPRSTTWLQRFGRGENPSWHRCYP